MAINTDLNVSPYFDDYDETKQYHRVLFKPARPLQARELTQMQTILQNQVERFGSNIYKEGTVISGCDFYSIDDLKYIKLNDAYSGSIEAFKPRYASLEDSQLNGGVEIDDYLAYTVQGGSSRLIGEIVSVSDGFITRNPDLKTLYIKYKGTVDGEPATVNVFNPGETLTVFDPFGVQVASLVTSTLSGYEGNSVGYGVTDGVIFQKGHFLYVQPQSIIISKYSDTPDNILVGFDIEESVVTSNQDESLLDNSQGFLNKNAPGADRLKLVPLLVKYDDKQEPEGFFTIVRFKAGEAVAIRDITEYNVLAKELAARTYNQSGNYVSSGMHISIEPDVDNAPMVLVSPGIAYSSGYELKTTGTSYFDVDPVTEISENISQLTGVRYGGYLPVNPGGLTLKFDITGVTTYNLYTSANTLIGTCKVQSIEDGKIYIANIRKGVGQETEVIGKIGTSTSNAVSVAGNLTDIKYAPNIYKIGGIGVSDVSEISFARRQALALSGTTQTSTITLPYNVNTTPIDNQNFVVIDQTNTQISIQTTTVNTDGSGTPVSLSLNLSGPVTPTGTTVYYDELLSDATPDFKTSITMYVKTNLSTQARRASLGVPDAYELVSVERYDTIGGVVIEDLTNSFALRTNQKDKFYDLSYIEEVGSDTITVNSGEVLLVRFKAFQHDNTNGDGFFVANSYVNVDRSDIQQYSASNGLIFDLASSFDFRPSVTPNANYSITSSGASTAISYDLVSKYTSTPKDFITNTLTMPGNNSSISSKTITYLSRVDQVVIDSSGEMVYRKGKPSKTPSAASTIDLVLAEVFVPGNPVKMRGVYAPVLKNTSVRAYTMKDISNIEKQINRILEISATSMLAQQSQSLLITDGNGNNRFKNGVMVDAFRDLKVADINNPEFFASIDKFRSRLTPAFKNFPVYLKRGTQSNTDLWSDIITKATDETEIVLSQKYATGWRNLVSAVFNYKGAGEIYPEYDGGFDVTTNPEPAVINIDFETPLVDLKDNINELLKMSGADTSVVQIGDEHTRFEQNTVGGQAGRDEIRTITSHNKTFALSQSGTNITNTKVGEFLTSAEFKPYMESKEIKILVYGLKPNTQHYFYFEEDAVSSMVKPAIISSQASTNPRARDVVSSGSYGDPVYTDANGMLTAVFLLPEETYLVGERLLEIVDVDLYSVIDSAKSSYAGFKYNAFNFDYEKQALTVNTRTPSFDVVKTADWKPTEEYVARFIPDPPRVNRDPLAQTFYIKKSAAAGNKYVFIDSFDVYFKSKSATAGVMLEIREVINGYPSRQIIPFAKKHLASKELNAQGQLIDRILTSQNGATATVFRFDNPIRLNTEKEYAIVLKPDGGDPSFNVFTAKLGSRDLQSNKSISQDWGDGVLFSSTNNRTWVPHQDEDLKFNAKINTFSTAPSTSNFITDDMEFFAVSGVTGRFKLNEIAYWQDPTTIVNAGVVVADPKTVQTANGSSVNIDVGQYAVLNQNGNIWVSRVIAVVQDECTLEEPSPFSGACTMGLGIGGIVTHFNPARPDQVHIKQSNATNAKRFVNGSQTLTGLISGATANIDTVDDISISFLQAHMYKAESPNSTVDFAMYNGSAFARPLPTNDELHLLGDDRVVESYSNVLGGTSTRDFNIVATLLNNGNKYASPIVDDDISLLQAYKYYISQDENTTSKYVSREVTLNSDLYAEGLKMFAACHRPPGTDIVAYARFKYKDNIETLSDWVLMTNKDASMRSNASALEDYREYEFEIPESDEKEFISFQIKFVLTSDSISQTPSLFDYRAIAVT